MTYDPAGRLYQLQPTGGAGTRFLYDGPNLVGEYNTSNVLLRRYVQGPGMDAPLVRYDGTGTSNKRWLLADERGSIIAETNTSGAVVQVNSYDDYGLPASGNVGRFGYTGQLWLGEIGMYSYKNRMYHPGLARFLQPDPIGLEGGMNLYAYVGGDPINLLDPWGLSPIGLNPWGSHSPNEFNAPIFDMYEDDYRKPPHERHRFRGCPFSHRCSDFALRSWLENPEAVMFFMSSMGAGYDYARFLVSNMSSRFPGPSTARLNACSPIYRNLVTSLEYQERGFWANVTLAVTGSGYAAAMTAMRVSGWGTVVVGAAYAGAAIGVSMEMRAEQQRSNQLISDLTSCMY